MLQTAREAGDRIGGPPAAAGAMDLGEQVALGITQCASGKDKTRIRKMPTPALSVFTR